MNTEVTSPKFNQLTQKLQTNLALLKTMIEEEKPHSEIDAVGNRVDDLLESILGYSLVTPDDRISAIQFAMASLRDLTDGNLDFERYFRLIERAVDMPTVAATSKQETA